MASDPGLRFVAMTMPASGTFDVRFDMSRAVESYSLTDRFSDLSDGQMGVLSTFQHANELLVVDRSDHANDKGTVIRALRGQVPVAHWVLTRIDDKWDSKLNIRPLFLEGAEYFLDKTFVPLFDYLTTPYRNPDWIYGAESVFNGVGDETTTEVQTIYREAVVSSGVFTLEFRDQITGNINWNASAGDIETELNLLGYQRIHRDDAVSSGTFTLDFSGQITGSLNWNATAGQITTALEALSNITDVSVSGTGSVLDPWFIDFVDPVGNQQLLEVASSTLNGNLYIEAFPTISSVTGDGSASLPWTITFEEPHTDDIDQITVNSSTLNGNLFVTTLAEGGVLSPRPFTMSFNPVTQLFHGTYDFFRMVTTPLYLDSAYSLEVNTSTPPFPFDYGGAQVIVDIQPGGFYRAELPVFATTALTVRFVIRDMDEGHVMSLETTLTPNVWTVLKIPNILFLTGHDQCIFRIGVIHDGNPGPLYISTKYALLAPGNEAAPLGYILGQIHDALQTQGDFTWVTRSFTDTHDSKGVAWDRNLSVGINHGQSLLQLHEYMNKWNYRWGFDWSVANSRWEWHAYNPGTTLTTIAGEGIVGHGGVTGSGTISTRAPEATHYQVDGDGGQWGQYTDTTMTPIWGKLMKFYSNAQGLASDDLTILAQALVDHASESTEGIMVELQNPDVLPWTDFKKGDVLPINLEPKFPAGAIPVMGIVASKEPKSDPKYQIHLNAMVYEGESAVVEQTRRLMRAFKASQFQAPALGAVDPAAFAGGAITVIPFSLPGQAFLESGRLRIPMPPITGVILGVKATCHIAPTGASIIMDVHKNGTTIFTTQANRPTIAAGTNSSLWKIPDDAEFDADDDYLTVDTDQTGSTIPGGDIVIAVRIQEIVAI